jgi:hypothetical protein
MSGTEGILRQLAESHGSTASWNWIWPHQGATPISEGLDSEMFDRDDYPYSETFVREAIQNTLDARLDISKPVVISFRFHRAALGERYKFLKGAIEHRKSAKLPVPAEWTADTISWLTVEDFNAKGLQGDLRDRMGDFWNYWLNFNVSNKDGSGRGGRGIGRVTFLIASRVQAVIGFSRRTHDQQTVACGMCVLKATNESQGLRSTHAYLAKEETRSIYQLYDSPQFHSELARAFELNGYRDGTGLALIIPYPHEELAHAGILASAIEHFAPAILGGSLIVRVDDQELGATTIDQIAEEVAHRINSKPIREDVERYLGLIRAGLESQLAELDVSTLQDGLSSLRNTPIAKRLQTASEKNQIVSMRISLPLIRNGRTSKVSLKAVASKTPTGRIPIDRFFREGMSLPDLKARNPGEFDLVITVDEIDLARYLNLCEGKAHLDITQSKEIKTKLEDKGFVPPYPVKNFVKGLPVAIRTFLMPDITAPDSTVFDSFFSLPNDAEGNEKSSSEEPGEPPPPPPPPPPPKIGPFTVEALRDGFKLRTDPRFSEWPVNVSVRIAYADGTRKPAWSEFDFRPSDLKAEASDCEMQFVKNRLEARNCGPACQIEVRGFDTNLELDTQIRFWKYAQTN